MTRARKGLLVSLAAYLAVTIIQCWPLLLDLRYQLPSDRGDPVLNAWILWWDAHAWPLSARWWNAPAFFPARGVLTFSENLLGLTPITTPVQWLTGSTELAYNIAFLLSFPLSAIAMHLLVHRLTGRDDVAFVAGAAFGFSPYRVAHLPHIQVLFSFWMPLSLLGLHAGAEGRRWGFPVAAACWLLQGVSNGYFLVFFPVLAGLWLLWFSISRPKALLGALAWFALFGLILLPVVAGYRSIHAQYGFVRAVGEMEGYSADLMSIFAGSFRLRLWGAMWHSGGEGELFPGFAMLAIGLVGAAYAVATSEVWRIARPDAADGWLRWVRLPLLGLATIFGSVALASYLSGGFRIDLGFATIPVFSAHKPFTVCVVAGSVYLLLGLRAAQPPRMDRTTLFYLFATAAMLVLSWGPSPRLFHRPFLYKAPYAWLASLPGFSSLRVPARFGLLFGLCLAVSAALVLARRVPRGRRASAGLAVLGLVVIAEGWFGPVPVVLSPLADAAPWLSSVTGAHAVIELPIASVARDVAAQLRGSAHRRPVVNGYSGFFPPSFGILERALRLGDFTVLEGLRPFGPIAVVLDRTAPDGRSLEGQLDDHPLLERRGRWREAALYWLPHAGSGTTTLGPALPISGVRASVNGTLDLLTDGALATRWTTGAPQRGGEWIAVDLGSPRDVAAIVLRVGRFVGDYPRGLRLDTSGDGVEWTEMYQGSVAALAFRGALDDPQSLPIMVPVGARCRHVRVTQIGHDPELWWSVAEMSLHGPPSGERR